MHTSQPSNQQPHQHLRLVLQVVRMRPLCAVEKVLVFTFFGFGMGAIGVGVGYFGSAAECSRVDTVPGGGEGGEGGDA